MQRPKFANPHFLAQSTQVVSRADLDKGEDELHIVPQEPDEQDVVKLEKILKQSLGDLHLSPQPTDTRKHKRRKLEKETGKDEKTADVGEESLSVCAFYYRSVMGFAANLTRQSLPTVLQQCSEARVAQAQTSSTRKVRVTHIMTAIIYSLTEDPTGCWNLPMKMMKPRRLYGRSAPNSLPLILIG